jgi:hypothetical protein
MKQFFKNLFDDSNTINEKAIIGFMSFIIMVIFAIIDVVTGLLGKNLVINEFIYDSFKILTIAGFGKGSIDKWINRKDLNSNVE